MVFVFKVTLWLMDEVFYQPDGKALIGSDGQWSVSRI
jgi:hypothetical protein